MSVDNPWQAVFSSLDEEITDSDDVGKFCHYVVTTLVVKSFSMGTEVRALCGKEWIPTKEVALLPKCPECVEVFATLPTPPSEN